MKLAVAEAKSLEEEMKANQKRCFEVMDGEKRFWSLRFENKSFSKRFRAKTFEEFEHKSQMMAGVWSNYEVHMTVEEYGETEERMWWTLVFDIDGEGKSKGVRRLKSYFDKSKIPYLLDSREHIWIPDWVAARVNGWNQLRDPDVAGWLKMYFEKAFGVDGLDVGLLYYGSHQIRAPYSRHLATQTWQTFVDFEGRYNLLAGEADSKEERLEMLAGADKFASFFNRAVNNGRTLWEAFVSSEENAGIVSKSNSFYDSLTKMILPKGYRGIMLWRVICPYLINVKGYDRTTVKKEVLDWLTLCSSSPSDDRDLFGYVDRQYEAFKRKGSRPLKVETLLKLYPELGKLMEKVTP